MANEKRPLNVVCVGAGYVGGPTMVVIAKKCPHITVKVFDISQSRIDAWNAPAPASGEQGSLPIYEPGLAEMLYEVRGRNIFFTTDRVCLKTADVIFVAVNTPTKEKGKGEGFAADLTYIESCAHMIGEACNDGHHIIVEKSTVPVRCSASIRRILKAYNTSNRATFSVVSNPEFLAEGTAINDLLHPDRVLIGGECGEAIDLISSIYENWVDKEKIIRTNLWSSELSKLVANAFLAQRISSINSITPLCELSGADVGEVRRAIGADRRIGPHFLNPSVGFGGSCFQKDILNLVYLCHSFSLDETAEYWTQVVKMNNFQKERFYQRIVNDSFNTVNMKSIAIMGFAFKKDTCDTRESPSIYVCARLLQEGAKLRIYDPKVTKEYIMMELENFFNKEHLLSSCSYARYKKEMSPHGSGDIESMLKNVELLPTALDASRDASIMVIMTEWDEFATMNYQDHYNVMKRPPFVFDGRLIVDQPKLEAIGFEVCTIGKPSKGYTNYFLYGSPL